MNTKSLLSAAAVALVFSLPAVASAQPAATSPSNTALSLERSLEACTNGFDDDQDGFRDCFDQDCQMFAVCATNAPRAARGRADEEETRIVPGLLATGSVVWGLSHLAMIAGAAIISEGHSRSIGLASIPLAGPWALLAAEEGARDYLDSIVPLGITQLSGFILTMVGAGVRVPVKDGQRAATSTFTAGPSGAGYSIAF